MKLSISIMAHASRREWVGELQQQLGPVPVAMDDGAPSRERMLANGERAWSLHDPAADWHLVLQDDVRLAPDFVARAEAFLERLETPGVAKAAVSFYCAAHARHWEEGLARGWCFGRLRWGPAICLPVPWITAVMRGYRSLHDLPHYDTRIGSWLHHSGRGGAYHPLPCLVEHRGEESLIGNRSGRRAAAF